MAAATIEELSARVDEIKLRLEEIDAEHAGQRFSEQAAEEWEKLHQERDQLVETIQELRVRRESLGSMATNPNATENGGGNGSDRFQTRRPGSTSGDNIWDLASVRRDYSDPTAEGRELRDRALRAVEIATFPHPDAEQQNVRTHVGRLLDADSEDGKLARYLLATGNPTYKRAFPKLLGPGGAASLSREEQQAVSVAQNAERAMSLTGSAGGFAVPYELDPTIIPTSNSSVNPWRAVARVEAITVDEWRGVSAGAVAASYVAEATEATDDSPTLAQPTISTERAQAFIPFSIEIGMDWNGLQANMARLLQDAKDDLEATKFATGSGTQEPTGVITGATTTVTASGTNTFAIGDLNTLESALPERFRPRAAIVFNRKIAQRIRGFDTTGGAGLWNQFIQLASGLPNNVPANGSYDIRVLGYPAYESSAMAQGTTTGQKIAIIGDFSYFVIVDRIGLTVETIPHLFGTNRRPTGQRGLYAYWRNSSGVISPNAFRVLVLG